MFLYNVLSSRCISYNIIALLAEVNSIFLHTRKLLQMRKWSFDHWLYKGNLWLNLITFIPCRFGAVAWINYGMYHEGHRVSPAYFWTLATAIFVMWGINIFLFWRLLKNDVLRGNESPDGKAAVENGINSNNNEKLLNGTKHKLNWRVLLYITL